MDSISKDVVFQFHEDTLLSVRKEFDLDKPGRMNQAIDALEEWLKKQDHFVKKDFPRDYLERRIIFSKGSVERAKTKLDKICTLKTLIPTFYENIDLKTDYKESNIMIDALLPQLTEDHCRIYLIRNIGKQFDNGFTNYFRFLISMAEYVVAHDYSKGFIVVLDYLQLDLLDLIKKYDIVELRQFFTLLLGGYGMRVKAIHIVTPSKVIETLVSIIKPIIGAKISERIQVHKDLESLHKVVSKDILPVEQGGNERSLTELHEEWINVLSSSEHQEYFNNMKKAVTDENYRQTDKFNEAYMGLAGTFRTLSVD